MGPPAGVVAHGKRRKRHPPGTSPLANSEALDQQGTPPARTYAEGSASRPTKRARAGRELDAEAAPESCTTSVFSAENRTLVFSCKLRCPQKDVAGCRNPPTLQFYKTGDCEVLEPEIARLLPSTIARPWGSPRDVFTAWPAEGIAPTCLASVEHLDYFKRLVQEWFYVKLDLDTASREWYSRVVPGLIAKKLSLVVQLPGNTLYLFPFRDMQFVAMIYPTLSVNLREDPFQGIRSDSVWQCSPASPGEQHASPGNSAQGTSWCPPRPAPAALVASIREDQSGTRDTSSDAYLVSRKYFSTHTLAGDDFVADGFFDPGREAFATLNTYRETRPEVGTREVIYVDQRQDDHLASLLKRARHSLSSFVDQFSQAKVLAAFVSISLGGDSVPASVVDDHVSQIQLSLGCVLVPLGMLRLGSCRHRSILYKYLCDRFGVNCELRRGSLLSSSRNRPGESSRHAWNVVCFGDNSYVVDVTMEPLSLIPVGSEEAMRYIEEGTRIEEHPLVRPELSERSCVTVPDLRERALLHERLGRGSISEVFRATVGGVACALKVISLARMTADQRRYVEREVQIMEMARHENIVRYLGHENIPDKEEMHIMMELFPESLTQLITKRKGLGHRSLALGEIKMLAIQVLSGIDYLHGRNIVHADLKSDNILVDFDAQGEFNRIKISDLGVCQVAESCDSQSVACHVGTTVYMAPEAMTRGEYSTAADVWSFGLLLVEMISLARPYASLTPSAAIMKIESGEAPEFPSPGCSKQAKILAAARRCLIRDPQSRPSAERLLVDFHRIQCNC